jgi:hypothetical protein
MKQIIYYNESGEIVRNSINTDGHSQFPPNVSSNLTPLVFEEIIDITGLYFNGIELTLKSELIIPDNIAVGDVISIPNVVPYDILFIDGEKFVLDDNVLDLEFETIGTYEIRFMLSRYIHEIKTVIVS